MTAHEFGKWLEGFMDACGDNLTKDQCALIRDKARTIYASYPYQTTTYPQVTTLRNPPDVYYYTTN